MNPEIVKLVRAQLNHGAPFAEALRKAFDFVKEGKGFDEEGTVKTEALFTKPACGNACATCPCK
jgi:hypothetical protein